MPHPTLDQGSQTPGCGTSRLHCPLRHAWENVREAPFHREALEGSKHRFTASLSLSHEGRWQCLETTSYRLSEVNDSVRNLCWLVRFFKRNAVSLEELLWPMLVAVRDGNHFVGHALRRAEKGKKEFASGPLAGPVDEPPRTERYFAWWPSVSTVSFGGERFSLQSCVRSWCVRRRFRLPPEGVAHEIILQCRCEVSSRLLKLQSFYSLTSFVDSSCLSHRSQPMQFPRQLWLPGFRIDCHAYGRTEVVTG